MAKYVAFIDNARKRKPVKIEDKQILSKASASSIADFGHAWIINGDITEDQIKDMFNRPPKDVLVYDAYDKPYELSLGTATLQESDFSKPPDANDLSDDSIDDTVISRGK